ncbi:MAG: sigma-70 family RNA polymerase sigma factor [Pseudomonadota bacterium]|nr:sigma-70 family RNA polymerase sigma factor [Pseudomonadota bacterium]
MAERSLKSLLAAVARRDRQAFLALYAATSGKLFGIAIRILKRSEMAEDVVQDAYVRVWNGAGDYSPALGSPMSWMATIVRNRAIDLLRKRTESSIDDESGLGELPDDAPDPFALTNQSQELSALLNCMGKIDDGEKRCLMLAYYYGYTHEEIAARTKSPVGTVKSRIRRGLAKVRECLDHG